MWRSRVEAVADERSVILALPTGRGDEKRLLFVNFDEGGIRFEGLEAMVLPSSADGGCGGSLEYPSMLARDVSVQGSRRGDYVGVRSGKVDTKGKKRANEIADDDNDEQAEDAFKGKKPKNQAHAGDDADEDISMADAEQEPHTRGPWARTEPAQWRSLGNKKGFHFVYRKPSQDR